MIDSGAATGSLTSSETDVSQLDKASIHCLFSTANSGTFTVEAKNGDSDTWYELNFGSPLTITTETDVQILLNEMPFTRIRLKWVPSAGAGTLTATITSKTVGG